jgi:hypothetical protein
MWVGEEMSSACAKDALTFVKSCNRHGHKLEEWVCSTLRVDLGKLYMINVSG